MCARVRACVDFSETRISTHPLLKLLIMTTLHLNLYERLYLILKGPLFFGGLLAWEKATASDNPNLRENSVWFKIAIMKENAKRSVVKNAIHSNELTGDKCCIYMPTAFTS